jgi:hypothetical protein
LAYRGLSLIQTLRIQSFRRFLLRSPTPIGHDKSFTQWLTKLAALTDSFIWWGDLRAGTQSLTQTTQCSIECWMSTSGLHFM